MPSAPFHEVESRVSVKSRRPIPQRYDRWMMRRLASICAGAWAVPVMAQTKAVAPVAQPSVMADVISIILPIVFVIAGLIVILQLLRKRYGLTGTDAPLSVVQILPVGPRERVVLVRTRSGKVFALGVASHAISMLTQLEAEDLGPPKAATELVAPAPLGATAERIMRWRSKFGVKQL